MKKIISALIILCFFCLGFSQASTSTRLRDTSLISDSDTVSTLKDFAIDEVYLQIDQDINLSTYQKFITSCAAKNIRVYALDGSADRALDKNSAASLINWVAKYNKKYNNDKFAGIHLDVEPYLLDERNTNQDTIVTQYQSFVTNTINLAKRKSLKTFFDIPFWFDEISSTSKSNLAKRIITKADGVTIMAYRNTSKSLLPLIKNEVAYAKSAKKPLTIGLETNKSNEGSNISFYGMGRGSLDTVIDDILNTYSKLNIAIHDYQGLLEL